MELDPALYTVAWIAPLEIEARAALYMIDHKHEGRFPLSRGDDYVYQAGDINGHNVIIATLPAGQEYGTGSAGALAAQIKKFFPNLWFGLLVGVAAGLPNLSISPPNDIRLGDILVGIPDGDNAGLKAYDLGKQTGDDDLQLLRGGYVLASTEPVVRSAIGSIKLQAPDDAKVIQPHYQAMRDLPHSSGTFIDPGQEMDILYDYNESGSVIRIDREKREDSKRTRVWYGTIGSGEKLLKSLRRRNELRDKHGLIGLEMEAAGLMNRIPVGVIRGVCDYGDENKNKQWQPYAAAMAAAYAKAVLCEIPPKSSRFQRPTVSVSRQKSGLWTVPFHRNPHFVGRQDELARVQKHMSSDNQSKRMAFTELGGIGKTQMAIELAYQAQEKDPDCSVFWIPCMSLEDIERGNLDIIEKLRLKILPSDDAKQRVKIHLSQKSAGRWLLILDNADDMDLWTKPESTYSPLKDYLPESPKGFVLITTRNRKIAIKLAASDVIPVPQMDLNIATHMLRNSLIQTEIMKDHGIVEKLLQKLEFLPLAISQAAAYINENGLAAADYLSLLEEQEEDVIELLSEDFEDQWRYNTIKNPVAMTWLISLNQVRQLNTLAASYISFMACIHPKNIPFSLLPSASSRKARTDAL